MKLKVMIGSSRFSMSIANVNDQSRPTEIDTPLFAGRIVVFVKDFVGVTADGREPIKEHPYFAGRSRKFAILIEGQYRFLEKSALADIPDMTRRRLGRFKKRDGVEPYTGEEIQFGSDFDFLPASFPQGPFNMGLKVAQHVDPATFAEMNPKHGRPFIMSPYVACMNTFASYPSPDALPRALVLAHHDSAHPHNSETDELSTGASFVPREDIDSNGVNGKKTTRHEVEYWRFVGLKGEPRTEEFIEKYKHLLAPTPTTKAAVRKPMLNRKSTLSLGTSLAQVESPEQETSLSSTSASNSSSNRSKRDDSPPHPSSGWGAPIPKSSGDETPIKKKSGGGRFSLASLMGALSNESSGHQEDHLHEGDLITADRLLVELTGKKDVQGVEKHLGPWRFADPGTDAIEDSLFIFLDPTHNRSVAQRRKYFVQNHGEHRSEFTYSPDVVYTASFFTSFCDLNTFDLKMGPVNLNIASHFTKMPIRYTLRSTRFGPRADGKDGPEEEEVFATISFQLVDE